MPYNKTTQDHRHLHTAQPGRRIEESPRTYNEAETRFWLIDPVLRGKGFDASWKLKLETPAPVEPTGNKGRRRAGVGRTDYLLCVQAAGMPQALPVGVIEANCHVSERRPG